jgi:histidinol phosphatase-like PHP family hydrolase
LDERGNLNVSDDVLKAADIVLGSVHGKGKAEWLLRSPCDVIAHPKINQKNIKFFMNCKKTLEINSKHRLPYKILDRLVMGTNNSFVFGSDSHSASDFSRAQKYFKKISEKYKHLKITIPIS